MSALPRFSDIDLFGCCKRIVIASATTRNNSPRTYVRLWHLADIASDSEHVRF
jgi:hypothetical protein